MIRALIVDDEPLPRERIRTLVAEHAAIEVIGECRDGEEALQIIIADRPDLVFLDIQMPGLDGLEVVAALDKEKLPAVIFVTAYDEYAIKAFELAAIDYLLKPVSPERLAKAVNRAIRQISDVGTPNDARLREFIDRLRAEQGYLKRFVVRSGSKLTFVRADDVEWIDVASNYVRLHVAARAYLVRQTMKALESQLNPDTFVRVHRSIIINIECVDSVAPHVHGEYVVTMRDGTKLTTSRSYSERLRLLLR